MAVTEELLIAAASNSRGVHCLDFLLKKDHDAPITRAVLEQALKNPYIEECLMLILDRGGQITESMMISAARNGKNPKRLLQILLRRGGKITSHVMFSAAEVLYHLGALEYLVGEGGLVNEGTMERALNSPHVSEVLKRFLETGAPVTERIVVAAVRSSFAVVELMLESGGQVTQAVLIEAASNADRKTLELLMGKGVDLTEEMMLAAARNRSCVEVVDLFLKNGGKVTKKLMMAAAGCSVELLRFLLQCPQDVDICEDVLVEAIGNERGTDALKLLLTSGHIPVTEAMVVKAAQSEDATDVLTILLRKGGPITDNVVVAAAENKRMGALSLLLEFDSTIPISEKVVIAAAGNMIGIEMLELIAMNGHYLPVSEKSVLAAAGNRDREAALELLLETNESIPITEQMLIRAVQTGNTFSHDLTSNLKLLLSKGGEVTEAVVIAALNQGFWDTEMLGVLITHNSRIELTEEIMLAAVRNDDGAKHLKYLLDFCKTPRITEAMLIGAAEQRNGHVYLEQLLNVSGNVTEPVFLAAAENFRDVDALEYLFSTHPMPVTENMLLAAAAASATPGLEAVHGLVDNTPLRTHTLRSTTTLVFLLERASAVLITEAIVVNAARSMEWECAFDALFSVSSDLPITEPVLSAAAENCGTLLELLFNKSQSAKEIVVTERMLLGAAFSWEGKHSLVFLHKVESTIEYTEKVMVGASWNPRGREHLQFLIAMGGQITETVMVAAALSTHGKESLQLLLGCGGQITETVMIAAAWNPGLHAKATSPLEFLMSRGGIVNEKVVRAAAMNPGGGVNLEFLMNQTEHRMSRNAEISDTESVEFLMSQLNPSTRQTLQQVAREFRWPEDKEIPQRLSKFFGDKIAAVVIRKVEIDRRT
ncbi:hypothetical protein PT974_04357 [Cladobotryum mycophilum]|uniref:Ankyrin repeat protein n=1 Tax=Cladobotryum mycophilum TaxID=491253 RepID=A0ABR0SUV0_9HYPO